MQILVQKENEHNQAHIFPDMYSKSFLNTLASQIVSP